MFDFEYLHYRIILALNNFVKVRLALSEVDSCPTRVLTKDFTAVLDFLLIQHKTINCGEKPVYNLLGFYSLA